jgi:rhodanese-related sulfurtransferase/DNA-binding transcriptional ArsR family regulator
VNPRNIGSDDKLEVYDALAEALKAIANGRRLELVELLAQGEHSVEVLARMTGMPLTTVSSALQTLRQAGLVRARRERTTMHYSLAGPEVAELYLVAKRVALRHSPTLRATLDGYLEAPEGAAELPLVSRAEVAPSATVLDVRPRLEYDAGHVPGAVSIPLDELEARHVELDPDGEVVVYCRGEFCRMAREAAILLRAKGLRASAMNEGVIEWRATNGDDLARIA